MPFSCVAFFRHLRRSIHSVCRAFSDLPTEAEQAEKEPERFLQRHPPPVIIDEVQYAPGLFDTSRLRWMLTARATDSFC